MNIKQFVIVCRTERKDDKIKRVRPGHDLSGKQVYKEEVRVEENMVKSISVNNMPSQWYVVTVRGMGVSYSQRFMVQ